MKACRGQYSNIYTTCLKLLVVAVIFITFSNQSFSASDIATQLEVLHKLKTDGVITQEEFNKAKKILLESDKNKSDSDSASETSTETTETSTETTETSTEVASLPTEPEEEERNLIISDDFQINQLNKALGRSWEAMEIIYKDYRIYTSRPGVIKIKRISDKKQLLLIKGNLKVKYFNNSQGLFDITSKKKDRPSIEEDLMSGVEEIEKTLKNPIKKLKKALIPKKLLKKDKSYEEEKIETREEISLELRIDGLKILHWDGRYVPKYKAFFYQVFASGYKPFHFYISLKGKPPFALNMKLFNRRIDKAVRRAKERLADEHDLTLAQIDAIIEKETGSATEEATQEAVAESIASEVEAAVQESVGEAMSAEYINAIEQATGEAIDEALEAELAAAIDQTIQEAVAAGIEQAAIEAGIQAMLDVYAAGGTDAEALAAGQAACGCE